MIAIVYPQFYGVGGIARYLDSFLSNLPNNSPTIYLITGDEHQVERHYASVQIIHIPFTSNRFNLFFWILAARKIVKQLYAEQKIKAVNLHIPPLIPGLFLPKQIPLILTAHTTYIGMSGKFYDKPYFLSQWNDVEIAIKRWIEKRIFKQAAKIIALTEQGKQELLTYAINKPIAIIPNGADLVAFKPSQNIEKTVDVLFCGRIEHRKGSRAMVQVCKNLIQQKSNIRIVIVGYGDDDVWVSEQLAPYSQQVKLTGKVNFSDMQAYYQASKLYVSTSYYEGLPGTCLEATAMGLPTIAWDFLFYRGLVLPDKTGYLIAPNDSAAMAQKIVTVLNDVQTHARLAANTRAHVEAHYNWADLSQQILQVFEN